MQQSHDIKKQDMNTGKFTKNERQGFFDKLSVGARELMWKEGLKPSQHPEDMRLIGSRNGQEHSLSVSELIELSNHYMELANAVVARKNSVGIETEGVGSLAKRLVKAIF